MSPEFLLTTLIIVASPGTGVVYTLAAGLSRGGRASVLAAFACTLGIVPHLVAALTGLAALLHTSALAFEIVKYAGVAYLLYMAWQTLREHGALKVEAGPDALARCGSSSTDADQYPQPETVDLLRRLPAAVHRRGRAAPLAAHAGTSGVFMAATFVIFAIYGLFAAAMRDHVVGSPAVMAWMRRTLRPPSSCSARGWR